MVKKNWSPSSSASPSLSESWHFMAFSCRMQLSLYRLLPTGHVECRITFTSTWFNMSQLHPSLLPPRWQWVIYCCMTLNLGMIYLRTVWHIGGIVCMHVRISHVVFKNFSALQNQCLNQLQYENITDAVFLNMLIGTPCRYCIYNF